MTRLKGGDHVRVPKQAGPVRLYHHGVVVDEPGRGLQVVQRDGRFGRDGVVETSVREFARGSDPRDIEVVEERSRFSRGEVQTRARSRVGEQGFNLVADNCEDFTSEVYRNRHQSDQVDRAARAAGLLMGGPPGYLMVRGYQALRGR